MKVAAAAKSTRHYAPPYSRYSIIEDQIDLENYVSQQQSSQKNNVISLKSDQRPNFFMEQEENDFYLCNNFNKL